MANSKRDRAIEIIKKFQNKFIGPREFINDVYQQVEPDPSLIKPDVEVSLNRKFNIAYRIIGKTTSKTPKSFAFPSKPQKGSKVIAITATPKEITNPERVGPIGEALKFRASVQNAGLISISEEEIAEAGINKLIPQGFDDKQLTRALELYSHDVTSKQLEKQVDEYVQNTSGLSEEEIRTLYAQPYLISAFEEYNPQKTAYIQSTFKPEVSVVNIDPSSFPPSENAFVFQSVDNSFQSVMDLAPGNADAQAKLKDFAFNAIKKGGSKLAEKKGVSLAFKAGVRKATEKTTEKLAKKGLQAAISTAVPGLGTAVNMLASKAISKLAGNKNVAAGGAIVAALGALIGSPTLIVAGVVGVAASAALGSLAITSAVIAATIASALSSAISSFLAVVAKTTFITIIAMVLLVSFILIIINQSAYIVPHNPDGMPDSPVTQSAYIGVLKTASPPGPFSNSDLPQTITYTITVTAKQGSLNNITFQSNCSVVGGRTSSCPSEENITISYPSTRTPCGNLQHCYPNDWSCTGILPTPTPPGDSPCPAGEQCASTCNPPPGPTSTPSPITNFPPSPPGTITPSAAYVITYTRTFNSDYEDSMVIDTFTVTADAPTATRETAAGRAQVLFGTLPPSSCPIIGGRISCGCYDGDESPPRCTHGSNSYWRGLGTPCSYDIPINASCSGPTQLADTGGGVYPADNNCRNNPPLCNTYGFATDSPSPRGTPVHLPTIYDRSIDWTFSHDSTNHRGSWGHSYTYTGTYGATRYQIFLTHLNRLEDHEIVGRAPDPPVPSGTEIGTLFGRTGFRSHVHIELQIDGQVVCPDFLCGGGGGSPGPGPGPTSSPISPTPVPLPPEGYYNCHIMPGIGGCQTWADNCRPDEYLPPIACRETDSCQPDFRNHICFPSTMEPDPPGGIPENHYWCCGGESNCHLCGENCNSGNHINEDPCTYGYLCTTGEYPLYQPGMQLCESLP